MRLPGTARALFVAVATYAGVTQAETSYPPHATACCSNLSKAPGLAAKVYLPDSAPYTDRMNSYWSVSAALSPWCVVQPSRAEDVSTIVKTLVASNCTFGVRGGGHGFFAGSNSVEDGVTIDFGNMNTTTYSPYTKLARIQPGSHWRAVYDTLAPHGVVVTGGRAGTVGVGGFITGGGNSFHSASHGFACDQVANFEVVLADGSIRNANASHHADLWQALKGSGANLGLVTRFDMYTIDFPDPANPVVWGGNLFYDLAAGPHVIDALVRFTDNVHRDENSSAIVYWAYVPGGGGMTLNVEVENALGEVAPPAFDGYYQGAAGSSITRDATRLDRMSAITADNQPSGFRNAWFTLTFDNDARVINYASERFSRLNEDLERAVGVASGFNTLCLFQPITASMVEKGVHHGGNVIGLDAYIQRGNGILFLLTLAVNGAEEEAIAFAMVEAYVRDVDDYAKAIGAAWDWKYLNYAHKVQHVVSSFGEAAVGKLRAASAKYDPHGVFQTLRGSGFKIPV